MGNKQARHSGSKAVPPYCCTNPGGCTVSAPVVPPSTSTNVSSTTTKQASMQAPPMPLGEAKRWFVCRAPNPQAKYRMLCLAWAGGNSTIYRSWDLGPEVEVVAVELPGRNARVPQTPLKNFEVIVARIAQALDMMGYLPPSSSSPPLSASSSNSAKPLLLFGHSFGAMLATHLALTLRDRNEALREEGKEGVLVEVPLVVLSGMAPLDARGGSTGVSKMSDDGMINYLVKMGGIPSEVASNRELMNIFLPAFRGDYTAIDNYTYSPFPPLPFRLICFAGAEDARADKGVMEGWRKFTTHVEGFSVEVFPGGHFFIKEHTSLVLERLGKRIRALG